jgi:hypothetical protein
LLINDNYNVFFVKIFAEIVVNMWLFYFALLLKVSFLHGIDPGHDPEINMTTVSKKEIQGVKKTGFLQKKYGFF